jgi:hypothetical protein
VGAVVAVGAGTNGTTVKRIPAVVAVAVGVRVAVLAAALPGFVAVGPLGWGVAVATGPPPPTVTVTSFVAVPPHPVAVSLYVVVVVGLAHRDPGDPTSPKPPGLSTTDLTSGPLVPFLTSPQLNCTCCPAVIVLGEAVK